MALEVQTGPWLLMSLQSLIREKRKAPVGSFL